jgi:6-pyruvoyltetrahydropterin/6-carboxytetrahydropterin synthase
MYTIQVSPGFSAAHHLREYKGKCENQHGHNWRVSVRAEGESLGAEGMLMDFGELRSLLREACAELDHRNINEHPDFTQTNPTAENIARWIFNRLEQAIINTARNADLHVALSLVTVEETDGSIASYSKKSAACLHP